MRRKTLRPHARLWSIILAAGASSRLGRAKQLLRYERETLLARSVRVADAVTPGRIVVVIGADAWRLRIRLRRLRARPLVRLNRRWREGMGGTLSQGVRSLPRSARAAQVLLTDQPRVSRASLGRLVGAWHRRPHRVAASAYAGKPGVPAIFPRSKFHALRRLRGDRGARLLLAELCQIELVAMPEAGLDIDTERDFERLRRR